MRKMGWVLGVVALLASGLMSACNGSTVVAFSSNPSTGTIVIIGTDSPTLSSVVSFQVPISGITLAGSGQSSVSVMDTPKTIDFARLLGLQTLLDIKPIEAGTYTSATIALGGNGTLAALDTSGLPSTVPSIQTYPAAFTTMSVTVNFPQPLSVGKSQVMGLLLDFRLDKSIPVSNGQIVLTDVNGVSTVEVTPQIGINFIDPQQAKMEIDNLRGGVVSLGSGGTFVIQGPGGRQFTVETGSSTQWEPAGQSFSTLTTGDIVNVEEAIIDPATLQVKAGEIDVIPDKFAVAGMVTFVNPPASATATSCAPQVQILVRSAIPGTTSSSFMSGQIATIQLQGTETYWVGRKDWIGSLFNTGFGSCTLVPGQALAIGGTLSTSGTTTTLTPKHVVLGVQGFAGTAVSTVGSSGTFTFNPLGLAGVLMPNPATVQTIQTAIFTTELENLAGFGSITSGADLHIVGLLLFGASSNAPEIFAGRIVQPES